MENKKRIISTKPKLKTRRTLLERYMKHIKEHKLSKDVKGVKYLGVPLERCEEIMGSINVGRPEGNTLREKLGGPNLWRKDWRLKNKG